MHVFLTACLFASAPAMQEKEAEKLFQTMETNLASLKSFNMKWRVEFSEGKASRGTMQGALYSAAGNAARIEFRMVTGGEVHEVALVSDGSIYVLLSSEKKEPVKEQVLTDLGALIRGLIARGGATVLSFLLRNPKLGPDAAAAARLVEVSDFKMGKKEALDGVETQIIRYLVAIKGEKDSAEVELWIDPKKLLPVKRVLIPLRNKKRSEVRFVETYLHLRAGRKASTKKFDAQRTLKGVPARKLYERMRAKVLGAETVTVKWSAEKKDGRALKSMTGNLRAKHRGSKFRVDANLKSSRGEFDLRMVSDGKKLAVKSKMKNLSETMDVPEELGPAFLGLGLRAGFGLAWDFVSSSFESKSSNQMDDFSYISMFELGPLEKTAEREVQVITFLLRGWGLEDAGVQVTIRIDTKTTLPTQMSLLAYELQQKETYSEFKVNEKIDDGVFEIK